MKTPRGCGEKFSAAGQLCKISEVNESNLVDVAPGETSSLPSAQLRTGAGTHTPRPRELRKCLPFDLCFNNHRRWLWVPAFAGTTTELPFHARLLGRALS